MIRRLSQKSEPEVEKYPISSPTTIDFLLSLTLLDLSQNREYGQSIPLRTVHGIEEPHNQKSIHFTGSY